MGILNSELDILRKQVADLEDQVIAERLRCEDQIADMIDITRGDHNQLVRNQVLATAILQLRKLP